MGRRVGFDNDKYLTRFEDQPAARNARDSGNGHGGVYCGVALELPDGSIVTGKNSPLVHAASALVLNAIKHLAGIPDGIHLLAPAILEPVARLKSTTFGAGTVSLDLQEALIALAISAATNPAADLAMQHLRRLAGCEAHMTHIPTPGDQAGLRKLGLNLTTEPVLPTGNLFEQ